MGVGSWTVGAVSLGRSADMAVYSRLRLQSRPRDFISLLGFCLLGAGGSGARASVEDSLRGAAGCARAIATNQGRIGLYAAVKAAVSGDRNRVILSPYTLYEVVNMVVYAGGHPVFVDTQPDAPFVGTAQIERLMDQRTAAVMLTHYHLPVPESLEIAKLARERDVLLIEDAAVSFGASLDGHPVGTIGDVGAFSFGLFKIINAFYGGALIGNNEEYLARIAGVLDGYPRESRRRLLSRCIYGLALEALTHPLPFTLVTYPLVRLSETNNFIARFARADANPSIRQALPTELERQPTGAQMELVRRGLAGCEEARQIREERARRYHRELSDLDGIVLPEIPDDAVGSWTEFPIVVRDRRELYASLHRARRDVRFYYYRNCAALKIFEPFAQPCPNAQQLMLDTLMLPLYPRYPDAEIDRNIEAIRRHYRGNDC
jgi:perosamine synthetase